MQSVAVRFRIVGLRFVRCHCIKFVKLYRDRQINSLHVYEGVDCVAHYLSIIGTWVWFASERISSTQWNSEQRWGSIKLYRKKRLLWTRRSRMDLKYIMEVPFCTRDWVRKLFLLPRESGAQCEFVKNLFVGEGEYWETVTSGKYLTMLYCICNIANLKPVWGRVC